MPAIQIRDVPPELHERLRSSAEAEGLSLSQYLLRELDQLAGTVPFDRWVERIETEGPLAAHVGADQIVGAIRTERAGANGP